MRGPEVFPAAPGRSARATRRERFDAMVLDVVQAVEQGWSEQLGLVEYAVEDTPQIPDDWDPASRVPLSTLVRGRAGTPARLVLFRRPMEHRAADRGELKEIVRTVIVQQVATLLGVQPETIDPDWTPLD